MKLKRIIIVVLLLSIQISAFSSVKELIKDEKEIFAELLYVSDGDTIAVSYKGKKLRVRLIGIDTPELHPNRRAKKQMNKIGASMQLILQMGKRASDFAKSLVYRGQRLKLVFDREKQDRYKRVLAYVYFGEHYKKMLNYLIIKKGYAWPLPYYPNIRFKKKFLKAYQRAKENKIGIWDEF